jgi:hypothetical protein
MQRSNVKCLSFKGNVLSCGSPPRSIIRHLPTSFIPRAASPPSVRYYRDRILLSEIPLTVGLKRVIDAICEWLFAGAVSASAVDCLHLVLIVREQHCRPEECGYGSPSDVSSRV